MSLTYLLLVELQLRLTQQRHENCLYMSTHMSRNRCTMQYMESCTQRSVFNSPCLHRIAHIVLAFLVLFQASIVPSFTPFSTLSLKKLCGLWPKGIWNQGRDVSAIKMRCIRPAFGLSWSYIPLRNFLTLTTVLDQNRCNFQMSFISL